MFVSKRNTRTGPVRIAPEAESETSVTAQIPLSTLTSNDPDLEVRFVALCQVLVKKGLVTEDELAEALRKAVGKPET